MYKVEYECVAFDEDGRLVHHSNFYTYHERYVDALNDCVVKMKTIASNADNCFLYIWHDDDIVFSANSGKDGVWLD